MYDNYNYPMGADTPSAPWNEREIPEVEMDCEVAVTLSRNAVVMTDLYSEDRDGNREFLGSYTDVESAYKDQYHSIPALLGELTRYINAELASGNISASRKFELEEMLDGCKGWEVGELEIADYKLQ